jgi:hypothetical protein
MVNKKLYAALLLSVFCVSGAFAAKPDAEMNNDVVTTKSETKRTRRENRRSEARSEAQRESGETQIIDTGRETTRNCGYTSCNKRHSGCNVCSHQEVAKPIAPDCEKWVRVTKPACEHVKTLREYSYTCPTEGGFKMVDRKA